MGLSKTGCFLSKAEILGVGVFFQFEEVQRAVIPAKVYKFGFVGSCFSRVFGTGNWANMNNFGGRRPAQHIKSTAAKCSKSRNVVRLRFAIRIANRKSLAI